MFQTQLNIPLIFPFAVAAAVVSLFIALRLKATRNAIEASYQASQKRPFTEEVIEICSQVYNRLPVKLKSFFKSPDINEMLYMAGRPYGLTAEEFTALKMIAAGLSIVFFFTAVATKMFWMVIFIAIILVPDWWLKSLIKSRRKKMDRDFFNAASKLAASLAGGLTLDKALKWAAGQLDFLNQGASFEEDSTKKEKPSPLQEELMRCIKENELGLSLDKVFSDFADRTGLLTARRMMVAVVQARKGLDVAQALSEAIDDARERRRQTIIAQAEMAEKRSTIALMAMLVPAIILTIAPMAITLFENGGLF